MIASRLRLLTACAVSALAAPANADLITIHIEGTVREGYALGSSFSAEWLAETGCITCDYRSGGGGVTGNGTSPLLSAKLIIGGQTITYPVVGSYGVIYAYNDQSIGPQGIMSSFYINVTNLPGQMAMNQFVDFYSVDLPGNLNVPFSFAVAANDLPNGSFSFSGGRGYLRPETVTLTNLSLVAVPGPGPSGLILLAASGLYYWRRKNTY